MTVVFGSALTTDAEGGDWWGVANGGSEDPRLATAATKRQNAPGESPGLQSETAGR